MSLSFLFGKSDFEIKFTKLNYIMITYKQSYLNDSLPNELQAILKGGEQLLFHCH